eukprot:g47503.t1
MFRLVATYGYNSSLELLKQQLAQQAFRLVTTVGGNVIVNTAAGVQQSTFQPINKRLTPHVISGTLTVRLGCLVSVDKLGKGSVSVFAVQENHDEDRECEHGLATTM